MTGIEKCFRYCEDIEKGRVLSNIYIKQAVKRFRDDLKKSEDPEYPYCFDEDSANKFCNFAECLKLYNDQFAGKNIELMDWQAFMFCQLYGWKKKKDGFRRFRKCFTFIGRKSGKSNMSACALIYDILTTPGAQGYCVATKKDQARIVWNTCANMIRQNESLSKRLHILMGKYKIENRELSGAIDVLSSEADKFDGLSPSVVVADEVSAMKNYDIVSVLESGMGARPEPLLLEITSGSTNPASCGGQEFEHCVKILSGEMEDPTTLALLYCLDKGDDWKSSQNDRKALPSIGITCSQEFVDNLRRQAIQNPSLEAEFRAKLMNQFLSPVSAWIPFERWQNCVKLAYTQKLDIDENPDNYTVIGAVDLAMKRDFTCLTLYYFDHVRNIYFARHKLYYPEKNILNFPESEQGFINRCVEQGYIELTPGETVDYEPLYKEILNEAREHKVYAILFDPYNSVGLQKEVGEAVSLVEIPQSIKFMSPFAKSFEASIYDGKIADNNPVVGWMVSNAEVYTDANDNMKIVKKGGKDSGYKIDAVVCSAMCVGYYQSLLESGELDFRSSQNIEEDFEKKAEELAKLYGF